MNIKPLILTAVLVLAPLATFAQSPVAPAAKPTIHQRKADQQGRIAGGARSGQLTPRETAHLEHQEAGINREERGMRAQDNGHLTKQDRRTLNAQQNQESKRIYRDKHNAARQ